MATSRIPLSRCPTAFTIRPMRANRSLNRCSCRRFIERAEFQPTCRSRARLRSACCGSGIVFELFAVFLVEKRLGRKTGIICLRKHPSLQFFRWNENAFACADKDKPLSLPGNIVCFEHPISPVQILLLSVWTTDPKRCRLLLEQQMIVTAKEIVLYLVSRVRACLRKSIDALCSLPVGWKKWHLSRRSIQKGLFPRMASTKPASP